MKIKPLFLTLILVFSLIDGVAQSLKENFKTPPNQYKPMPFWHINDSMTIKGINRVGIC